MNINMNDAFPSKWLKASDIDGPMNATINRVEMEEVGQGDHKPVLYLNGFQKAIVLNKTNANNITALYGPNSDGWIGKEIQVTKTIVDFQGQSMEAIRVFSPMKPPLTAPATDGFVTGTPQVTTGPQDAPPPASSDDYGAASGR